VKLENWGRHTVTLVVKLYWDRSISFVKNIASVETENAVVLGDIQDSGVIHDARMENGDYLVKNYAHQFAWNVIK
jgi:hypothetical protein